jgi:hypothetical protein
MYVVSTARYCYEFILYKYVFFIYSFRFTYMLQNVGSGLKKSYARLGLLKNL